MAVYVTDATESTWIHETNTTNTARSKAEKKVKTQDKNDKKKQTSYD